MNAVNRGTARRPWRAWLVAVCLASAATPGLAQEPDPLSERSEPPRLVLFGQFSYNSQWDDESLLGRGVGFDGGVGYRVLRKLWVEGLVSRLAHNRDLLFFGVGQDDAGHPVPIPYPATLTGSATYILAQARYVFSTSRVQPYVAGAFGLMHYSGNGWQAVFPPEPGQPRPEGGISRTSRASTATFGLDVAATRHVTVGPFFALLATNSSDESGTKMALNGGLRVGYGW